MHPRACFSLLLLLPACAGAPAPPLMRQPRAVVRTPVSGASIQRVSALVGPAQQGPRIGKADLDQARRLLSRARQDLAPRQIEELERTLTAAERAFERFSSAARASGQTAEVVRGAEGLAQAGRAQVLADALPRVGMLLAAFALLYPTSTAPAEVDRGPDWVDAQWEYEARLRDVFEASLRLMSELEAQPRAAKAPSQDPSPRNQSLTPLTDEDSRCKPIPLPRHLGGNDLHDECADKMPGNSFPGGDVYVSGKNFDALQLATRTLWEIKTDDFDKHDSRSQDFFIQMKLPEIQRERRVAELCGYGFAVGVRSLAYKIVLERADGTLKVVLMDWC